VTWPAIRTPAKANVVLCLFAVALLFPALTAAQPLPPPPISAPEAIIIDGWTGQILYARNADVPRYPASTVKIMTALVILQHHISLRRMATVSALAASYGGSTAGLWAGERLSVRNLLYAMLLPSGNDAAVALSQLLAPTPTQFASLMNAEAVALHLTHTHYLSPNGFDTWGQVTTARDLAAVARTAMRWRVFRRIVHTRYWHVRAPSGVYLHSWQNLNQLLWWSRYVDGIKTGTTAGAGACLVASARKDGRWVIAVNMGSSESTRFTDGEALLDYGFRLDR
jgi:D-alanyl-D-alanine carboxypeptidase (penicillin-binding protein 5/6)